MGEKISAEDLKARKEEFVITDVRETDELSNGQGAVRVTLSFDF